MEADIPSYLDKDNGQSASHLQSSCLAAYTTTAEMSKPIKKSSYHSKSENKDLPLSPAELVPRSLRHSSGEMWKPIK